MPDLLPDEPGGYAGFNALLGAKYVDPVIKPSSPMTDLGGNVDPGPERPRRLPGLRRHGGDGLALLGRADAGGRDPGHLRATSRTPTTRTARPANIHFAYGPGEAGYVQQLHDYDTAFQQFFDRLAADGINKSNTLFLFTVDEGDHFAGDPPNNPRLRRRHHAVRLHRQRVGEINGDLRRMVKTQFGDNTLFTVHSDDAPNVYITGNPSRTDAVTRNLEREMSQPELAEPVHRGSRRTTSWSRSPTRPR